MKIKLSQKAN